MSGQRRAFAGTAILVALTLAGCSATAGSSPEALCSLPINGSLERSTGGGFLYTYPNGSTARLAFANGSCVLDANPFPIQREERSEWLLAFTYDYYMTELAPCLNGFGFPALAPPSRAAFIDSGGDWSPYDAVHTGMTSGATLGQLSRVCPELPPGLPEA